ncbi:MAG TPA: hypothetical protein DCP91_07680 [Eggerthellaceae bacterium]|nr:hypothetical protein [Eggerthellaceae bacterium]
MPGIALAEPPLGNIVFTPEYEKIPSYNINYDPNGGTGTMDDNNYLANEEKMPHDKNKFTRKGYDFVGFKALLPDGTYYL